MPTLTAGSEILVNSTTSGNQWVPVIAWLPNGNYIVAWSDDSGLGGDASSESVKAQIFDANGVSIGGEFLINQNTAGRQYDPKIAVLADGNILVTWTDETGDADSWAVKARLYDQSGTALGNEFLVNTKTSSGQFDADVLALPAGGFVVTWSDLTGDSSLYGTRGQMFDATGAKVGAEFLVNTTEFLYQNAPSMAALPGGGFVVTWNDFSHMGGDGDRYSIRAQLYDAAGNRVGGEFLVNTTTVNDQGRPTVATLADGNFVITWMDNSFLGGDASGWSIRAQMFDSSGARIGSEFAVNQQTVGHQETQEIIALPSGGFLIAWQDEFGDGSGYAAVARMFDASGAPLGDEFRLNATTAGNQLWPEVIATPDGFAAVWSDASGALGDASGYGVVLRLFSFESIINGTPGDDVLAGTDGADQINGYAGDDTIVALQGNDVVDGGEGNDFLVGRQGDDTLLGGEGNDLFRPGVGDDYVDGGSGFDRVSNYDSGGATTGVTISLLLQGAPQDTGHGSDTLVGIEALSGSPFDDTLIGDHSTNWLIAGADSNDTLIGNGGDDLLEVGSGNHTVDGGPGSDTVSFANLGNAAGMAAVNVSLLLQDAPQVTGNGTMALSGIENLSGSAFDDTLIGDGAGNTLSGHLGNDALVGGAGDDSLYGDGAMVAPSTPSGNEAPTLFSDFSTTDVGLIGGNDILEGGEGNDHLDGGAGNDTASYANATGSVFAQVGFGADEYDPGFNVYRSHDTYSGIENITGSDYDDELYGDDNANVLDGRGGNDFIQGRGGDDTLYGGAGDDFLQGDRGDLFLGASGNDTIYGEGGNDTLRGGLGDDALYGGDGNDHFRGGGGTDSFDGGADDGEGFNGIGDRISFFEQRATQGVVADLRDGTISNDGFGNAETMTGIESLGGDTAYVDIFYGNDARNLLFASRGDHVYGFGADDLFQFASAPATADGGDGTDTMFLTASGGWLTPDTNGDGIAEMAAAPTEGWFVNLLGGIMVDGYGNFGTVTGVENVTGSELADTIRGDDNANALHGAGGDDFLVGNGGDDTIEGGDGNDSLRGDGQIHTGGAFGNDVLSGGAGDDHMRGGPGVDTFDGGSDSGTVNDATGYGDRISFYEPIATAGVVADLRDGTISNDGFGNVETMTGVESLGAGTAYADTFYGNDGRNFLFADSGDSAYGFDGDDMFQSSSAAAMVDGGVGTDVLHLTSAGGALLPDADSDGVAEFQAAAGAGWTVDLAAGTVVDGYGNAGAVTGIENVDGSELGDTLIGDGNANVLNGMDGDDTLNGRGGNDTLDGGNGTDTASYADAVGPVEVDLGAGYADEYDSDGLTYLSTDTLANFENATGSAFGDVLIGHGGDNVLVGLDGNDFLDGRAGDDHIDGGAGFDTANYLGTGSAVTVDLAAGTASGGAGNDTLAGVEAVIGTNFDDTLIGDSGANSLTGRGGNDTILAGDGDDFIRGNAGDDLMDGGAGFDRVSHYGTNILTGVTVDLRIAGPQDTGHGLDTYVGIEALSGSRHSDTLIGNDNANWLIAADGDDTLVGNGGNDLLTVADGELGAASGNHSIDGGADNDTLDVSWSALGGSGFTLSLEDQGAAQDSGHGMLTLSNIENLSGSQHGDTLIGDGNANTLSGHAGNDILSGGDGDDQLYGDGAMIADTRASSGGSGPVTFFGDVTTIDPSLVAGDDTLEGGAGNDLLDGGGGNDTASYANAAGPVDLVLQFGFAEEYAADGFTLLSTDTLVGIENAIGSAFDDALQGDAGTNMLDGGGGHDFVFGRGGDDQVYGGAGNDNVSGDFGAGVQTGGGNDLVDGGDGHDIVRGRDGNDIVLGGDGNDFVEGGTGDDLVDGGSGYDRAAFFSMASTGVTVDLNLQGVAQDTGQGMDTLVNIEHVSGTPFDDVLIGDGNDNWLRSGVGTDSDAFVGNGGNDLIEVGGGSHTLSGDGGNDTWSLIGNTTDITSAGVTASLALQGAAQDTEQGMMTATGFENLSGSIYDDNLTGDGDANVLAGDQGDDALTGGAGNDTLYGDGRIWIDFQGTGGAGPITTWADVSGVDPAFVPGDDMLEGGLGDDTLVGGGGSDTASYANAGGSVTVSLGSGTASGADGNDTLVGIENATGSQYADTLFGNNGDNVLLGLGGNDSLFGQQGNDTLDGGDGDDFASGGQGQDTLLGGAGNDSLSGNQGDDIVMGGDGDDLVIGNPGNDTLYGGDGGDFLRGDNADGLTIGNDYIDGGSGFDRATYYNTNNAITVDLRIAGPQNTGQGWDTLVNIEAISGSVFSDVFVGNDNDNWFFIGGAGIDSHTVTSDTISANGGNDLIVVGLGNHNADGGSGVDTLGFAWVRTAIFGGVTVSLTAQGTAQDTGQGTMLLNGFENLSGSMFNDTFTGDAGNNLLAGNSGSDSLIGGGGNDLLLGDGEVNLSGTNGAGPITIYNEGDYSRLDFYDSSGTIVYLFEGQDLYDSAGNLLPRADLVDEFGTAFSRFTVAGVDYDFYFGSATTSDGVAGDDTLSGGDGDDTLIAGAGDDLLAGGAGNDMLDGGDGNDTASYADAAGSVDVQIGWGADEYDATFTTLLSHDTFSGVENVIGSEFDDTIGGDGGANIIQGLGGNDLIIGHDGNDTIDGGEGNDSLRGDRGGNAGPPGDDTLLGGGGNDFLNGGFGNDLVDGGAGIDRATFYTGATAGVTVDLNLQGGAQNTGQGMDTLLNIENLSGTVFNDTLTGDGGDNWLWGSPATLAGGAISAANNDTLDGGGGNDLLTVGIGNHSLTGGSGTDTASFTENGNPEPGLTISLAVAGAQATGAGTWTLAGIENLSGGIANDNLTGDGNANVLAGHTGSDNLAGGGGNDTLYGDGAIEIDYTGGPGTSGPIATFADVTTLDPALVAGDDTLEGGLGNDTLHGGGGTDTATYVNAAGGVFVNLTAGTASGADGNDTLVSIENATGSAFADTLTGDGNANALSGLDGNDLLNGRGGDDTLVGGNGIDTATYVNAAGAVIVNLTLGTASGADGNDTLATIENVTGSAFADTLTGDAAANVLSGGDGNDTLEGRTGNDTLSGGIGSDTASYANAGGGVTINLNTGTASGADGSDTLISIENAIGSAFADTLRGDDLANLLSGGDGADTILAGRGDDVVYGGRGNDVMTGSQGSDRYVMEATSGSDTVVDFVIGIDKIVFDPSSGITSFSQLTITRVGGDARVSWAGGNSVLLQGVRAASLTASDFQFGSVVLAAATASTTSSTAMLSGAIAAAGLAESAAASGYSSGQLDSSAASGSGLHTMAFAPEVMRSTTSVETSLTAAPLFDNTHATLGALGGETGWSGGGYETSLRSAPMTQPTELLQPTAAATGSTSFGGAPQMTAAGISIPSAEQLAGLGPVPAPAQSNAIVGKVLADSLGGAGNGGLTLDALVDALPSRGEAPSALEALAQVAAAHDPGLVQFGPVAPPGMAFADHGLLHLDAAPLHT